MVYLRLKRTSQLHPPAASEAGARVRQMPGGGSPHHPRAHHHQVGSPGPLSITRRWLARPEHGSVRCLAAAHPIIPAPTTITSALPDLSASPAGGQRGRSTGPSDAWRRRTPSSPRPPPSRRLSRTSQHHPPAASEAGARVRQMPGGGAPHHPRAHHHHVGSPGPLSITRRRPARPEHGSVRCLAAAHPIIPAPTTITSALPDLSASPAGSQGGRSMGPSDAWRRRTPSSPRPPPSRRLSRTSQHHPPVASEAGARVRQMPGGGAPHHPRAHHHHVGSPGPLSITRRRPARPEHGSVRCLAAAHPIIPAPITITS